MLRARFDFPVSPGTGPAVYTDPVHVVHARSLHEVVSALAEVARLTADGLHAAGFIAYEAAPAFDPAMRVPAPDPAVPLLTFGLFDGPASDDAAAAGPAEPDGATDWALELTPDRHAAAIDRIHRAIAEGRTYQVNLTTRLRGSLHDDPDTFYHRLRRAQGDGYHALLDLGRHVILSASPELFFETRGRAVATRPMKGTRARGRWPEEDRALREALASSPKDRAENLMIVDLLRNDLGRVCTPGTVDVPELWAIERYRTVWQMTSTVTGTLRDDVGLVDLFRALFPCGSVTGAPKISTMALIADLETSPRGVYCGAIGRVLPGGDCTFNVPIRTAWLDRETRRITYGTGGGVVWDSTHEGEWDELQAKAAVIRNPWPPFRLLETLGVRDGRAVRLDRHLARMATSAERFDFSFPDDRLRAAIRSAARTAHSALLRVTLAADGTVDVETRALGPDGTGYPGPTQNPGDHRMVAVARSPVDPSDPFLYHKTTHRAVYRRHLAEAPDRAWDVLLWNEHGHATEFCRGNLVAELDGRLLTPPRTAGLLAGCLRDELLQEGRIHEADLPLEAVRSADALWFVNSARGWIPVRLQEHHGRHSRTRVSPG